MRSLYKILLLQVVAVLVNCEGILEALENEDISKAADMIGDGVDPNDIEESSGWTPLIFAAAHGETDLARMLVLAKADLNHQCNDGWSALMFAAHFGHNDIAKLLLDEGADVFLRANDGRDAHFIARSGGFQHIADAIEDSMRSQQQKRMYNIEGVLSPVHVAAHSGDVETLRHILTPDSVNLLSDGGWTPLILTAAGGHVEAAKALLEAGGDPNAADKDGWTPLMFAAHQGYVDLVALLMDAGADSLAVNHKNQTASDVALLEGHTDLAQAMYDIGLCNAIAQHDLRRQRAYLARGVPCHFVCYSGYTPLIHAAKQGSVEDVQHLLSCGGRIDEAEDDGWTPIMFGVASNHRDVVEVLLQHGADIKKQTHHGHDVYNIAEVNKIAEMTALLKKYDQNADKFGQQREHPFGDKVETNKKAASWSNLFGLLG